MASHFHHAIANAFDAPAPDRADPNFPSLFGQRPMQYRSTNAETAALGKLACHRLRRGTESDAAKRIRFNTLQIDSQRPRGLNSIRHQPFAASFVVSGGARIGQRDFETAAARANGGDQPRGTAADDKYICGRNSHQKYIWASYIGMQCRLC